MIAPNAPLPAGPDTAAQSRRAARFWGSMIVGLLSLSVGLSVMGAVFATHGKSVMVEADYYNKAIHWDQQETMQRASDDLGWKMDLKVGDTATTGGERALILTVTDKDGLPVENAQVSVSYFHHARALELHQADLKSVGSGQYATSTLLDRKGLWEFRVTIRRGTDKPETFIATLQRDLFE